MIKKLCVLLSFILCSIVLLPEYAYGSNSSSDDSVITLPSKGGTNLLTYINGNDKVEKLIFPKEISVIIRDDYYETDPWLLQNYTSVTPNCPNLATVEVAEENQTFTAKDGVLYSKDMTTLYYCPPGKKGKLIVPEGVTRIGFMALQECAKLTSIELPSTLAIVSEGAFGGNRSLTSLTVSKDNPNFKSVDNVLFRKYGEVLIAYAGGKADKSYMIPDGVKVISSAAFMGSAKLEKLYTCENLLTVGNEAFRNCKKLKRVHFAIGLHEIYAGAFLDCSSLSDMNFPEGLRGIYEDALAGCNNLLDINLPSSLQNIRCDLCIVANRHITYNNPYSEIFNYYGPVAKGVTFTAYPGTYIAGYLFSRGLKVSYLDKDYTDFSPAVKVAGTVVKGKGKADTGWYDKTKKTFQISNPDQLAGLATLVRNGNSFAGKTIQLMNDLDLSCYKNWVPIGRENPSTYALMGFSGSFDGNNHVIYNLRMNYSTRWYYGLFGINKGTIKNLSVMDAQVYGNTDTGILVGVNYGKLINCSVSGSVHGYENIGAVTGKHSGSMTGCTVNADVQGNISIGGIVGYSYGDITRCSGSGNVNGNFEVGGISGSGNNADILECTNQMRVTGDSNAGGILGEIGGSSVNQCTNQGEITGCDRIGGIVGNYYFDGLINGCKNEGCVTGIYYVGGVAGYLAVGTIAASENSGKVSGYYSVGGILGILSSVYPKVTGCTNSGSIDGVYYSGPITGKDLNLLGLPCIIYD